jgi:hypothetical protein
MAAVKDAPKVPKSKVSSILDIQDVLGCYHAQDLQRHMPCAGMNLGWHASALPRMEGVRRSALRIEMARSVYRDSER